MFRINPDNFYINTYRFQGVSKVREKKRIDRDGVPFVGWKGERFAGYPNYRKKNV